MFFFKRLVQFSILMALLGGMVLYTTYLFMRADLPDVESLKDLKWQTPMQIYSADGLLISQFGSKKRIPLRLDEFPQQLIDALLATEDDRFYAHFGVDPIGMSRAIIGQLTGNPKGGASTITMQVARNFFLSREVTYTRKIREIFLSFHIENLLSKDEILELYMNKIELGHRSFGFGAAAQVYYGKEVNDLSLAQIAVLAGLPKAPSTLNPIRSPERAKARRAVVLKRMLVSGYIDISAYEVANNAPITGKRHGAEIELDAPYIAEMAHKEMLERYGKERAYSDGYKVFTTVTSPLQLAAQHSVVNNLINYDTRHGYRGAIMSLRPIDNSQTEVEATSGSDSKHTLPLSSDEINNVFQAHSDYQHLTPAIVTAVHEKSATIILKDQQTATINWQGLAWARPYISDQKQGKPPNVAADILAFGDVIYVYQQADLSYTLSQLPNASAALVALSPDDGAINALVGGFSFKQSQFNRAVQAKRQVGSNIKPFIYSAALESGLTLASLVNDAPINQWDRSTGVVWRPKNSPPVYNGPIRVKTALAQSKNVIAVRLLREVGLDNVRNHLAAFGFDKDELPRNESLALGSASLTPLEVATGFAAFANGGFLISPYLIQRIEDSFGNIVYQANPAVACNIVCQEAELANNAHEMEAEHNEREGSSLSAGLFSTSNNAFPSPKPEKLNELPAKTYAEQVISSENAFLITQALNSAIWGADWSTSPGWQGTGFRARSLNRRDIAGKTGTTNEAKDAWFSGYSRRIVATSWIGFDDHSKNLGQTTYNKNLSNNQITGKEFGAKSAQPAWINFMETALTHYPLEPFRQPQNVISVRIDKLTGKLSNKTDRSSSFEFFQLGTAPTEYATDENLITIIEGENSDDELF